MTNVVWFIVNEGDVLEMSNYVNRLYTALSFFTRVKKTYNRQPEPCFESTGQSCGLRHMYALEDMQHTLQDGQPSAATSISQSGLTDKIDAQVACKPFQNGRHSRVVRISVQNLDVKPTY